MICLKNAEVLGFVHSHHKRTNSYVRQYVTGQESAVVPPYCILVEAILGLAGI